MQLFKQSGLRSTFNIKKTVFFSVFQKLVSWFIPATLLGEEELRKAKLLTSIILALLGTNLIAFVLALFEPQNDFSTTVILHGIVFLAIFGFVIPLKSGKINIAGWCIIIFFWIVFTLTTLFFGGLHSQIPVVFVIVIMFMGSFLGGRPAFILAVITILFLGLIAILESYNLMPLQLGPDYSPLNAWSALCVAFLLMSVLLNNSLKSIKEGQERYQLAMTGSAAGLWDWNIQTDEVYYSSGFKEMLGYASDEFPHNFLSLTDALHPEDQEQSMERLKAHLSSSFNNYDVEFRLRTKKEEYRWFHSKGEALRDDKGKPYRMVGSLVDITKRKMDEESIVLKNEELVKINKELDRFVYSASHDLRAPISSLLGLIRVARLENDPSSLKRLLDMQERSLQKLDKFIYDIVNYSRNNRVELEIEEIDFNSLLADIYEQLHYMDQLSDIKKIIEVEPNTSFNSDKKRISVILNNLISNAIKYNDLTKAKPFIKIVVEKSEQGVCIHVIDSGDGIDQHHIGKIFDMFYRGSERSIGSGIGLYIVKEVVEKLQGSIEVKSQINIGSEFIVRLPNLN